MNRTQFRAAMRKRINENQKKFAQILGLPKALLQYAKRHGVDAESIHNERLKYKA
jgi:hypothetical protein